MYKVETFGKLLGYFLPYFSLFKNYNTHTCSAHLFLFWYDPVPPEKILLPWEIVPDGEYHIPLDLLARRKEKVENHWSSQILSSHDMKIKTQRVAGTPLIAVNMQHIHIWNLIF